MKISANLLTCGRCLAPTVWNVKNIPTPYRLYYVEGGQAFFTLDGREFQLKKDHFYFFPSTLPFLIRQNNEDRLNHMYFNFIIDQPIVSAEPICASLNEHPSFPLFLEIMIDAVTSFSQTKDPEKKDVACHCLEAFLSLLFTVKPLPPLDDNAVIRGIEYMESHFKENITIKEVARELYINEDHFIRKFKKAMNMTPYKYLSRLRASVALELISSGSTLEAAAAGSGYQSASTLSHALKKQRNI